MVDQIWLCGKLVLIILCGPFGERNNKTFEDEEKSTQDIKSSFMRTLFEYRTMIEGVSCNYLVDFLDHMAVHL